MKRILFATLAVTLMVSLSFFPLIEGEIQDKVIKEEITIEVHTPSGIEKHTKELSIEEIETLSNLLEKNDVDEILSHLKKYGVLGEMSIREVKNLIDGTYVQQLRILDNFKVIENKLTNPENDSLVNAFCIFSTAGFTWHISPANVLPWLISILLWKTPYTPLYLISLFSGYLPRINTIGFWKINPTWKYPFAQSSTIYTHGLFGLQILNASKDILAITVGFTGIIISLPIMGLRRGALGFTLFATGWKLDE